MKRIGLGSEQAKGRVRDAVTSLEKSTSAEVVVAVRKASGSYRAADYLCGYLFALLALCAFLFHPDPMAYDLFPLEMTACFALGVVVSATAPGLRRWLTLPRQRAAQVTTAARSVFLELGIDTTRRRTGVLVYISLLEKRVELVADRGVVWDSRSPERAAIAAAFAQTFTLFSTDLSALLLGLQQLGLLLSQVCPPTDDDVNELDDGVRDS